jgi:hypothetical protein
MAVSTGGDGGNGGASPWPWCGPLSFHHSPWHWPCHAVPCRAVPCHAVPCRAVPCRADGGALALAMLPFSSHRKTCYCKLQLAARLLTPCSHLPTPAGPYPASQPSRLPGGARRAARRGFHAVRRPLMEPRQGRRERSEPRSGTDGRLHAALRCPPPLVRRAPPCLWPLLFQLPDLPMATKGLAEFPQPLTLLQPALPARTGCGRQRRPLALRIGRRLASQTHMSALWAL